MSLLKWKEIAKKKSELGEKINQVRNTITQSNIDEKSSQSSFQKVFKPVTSKLDDVIVSNLKMTPRKRQPLKKGEVPDYGISLDDEVLDYGLDDLFDEEIQPETTKQLVPKPSTYEESLQDLLEGKKEIYMHPQYLPPEYQPPPEYEYDDDDDNEIDYALDNEDEREEILNDFGIANHNSVQMKLDQLDMTPLKIKNYLNKVVIKNAKKKQSLNGYQLDVTKKYNEGTISEAERQVKKKESTPRGVY